MSVLLRSRLLGRPAHPSKHLAGSLQCLQPQTQILRALTRQEHARRPPGQDRKQFYFSKSKKPLVASGGSSFFLQMQPVGPVLRRETAAVCVSRDLACAGRTGMSGPGGGEGRCVMQVTNPLCALSSLECSFSSQGAPRQAWRASPHPPHPRCPQEQGPAPAGWGSPR